MPPQAAPTKQLVSAPLAQGLDTGTSPRQLQGSLLAAENLRPYQRGSLTGRTGYGAITGAYDTAHALAQLQGVPVLFDEASGGILRTHAGSAELAAGSWRDVGACPVWGYRQGVLHHGQGLSASPVDYPGIIRTCAMAELGQVVALAIVAEVPLSSPVAYDYWVVTLDRWSGQEIATRRIAGPEASASGPKFHTVIATAQRLLCISLYGGGEPKHAEINTTTGAISPDVSSGLLSSADSRGDAAYIGAVGEYVAVVYGGPAVSQLQLAILRTQPALAWTGATLGPAINNNLSVYGCFQWADGIAGILSTEDAAAPTRRIHAEAIDFGFTVHHARRVLWEWPDADGTIDHLAGTRSGSNPARVWWDFRSAAVTAEALHRIDTCTWTDGATSSAPVSTALRCRLAGKAWNDATGLGLVPIYYQTYRQPTLAGTQRVFYVLREDDQITARYLIDEAAEPRRSFLPPVIAAQTANGVVYRSLPALRWESDSERSAVRIDLYDIPSAHDLQIDAHELDDLLLIPGACPRVFDGSQVFEHGWHQYPDGIEAIALNTGGGALTAPATYGICAVYEWYDARGRRWLSTPSPVVSLALVAPANAIRVDAVPTASLGRTQGSILIYRTTANGSIFYLDTRWPNIDQALGVLPGTRGPIPLEVSDTVLAAREVLYTTGGVVDRRPLPPYWASTVEQDRLIYVPLNRRDRAEYTLSLTPGQGIDGSDWHQITLPEPQEIVALARCGRYLVLSTADTLWYSYGAPLSDSLQGSGYSTPAVIDRGAGMVRPRAIAAYPGGILFLAAQGICQLSTSLQVSTQVGEPSRYITQIELALVRAAVTLPASERVVFLCRTRPALVYHWRFGLWTTYGSTDGRYHSRDGIAVGSQLVMLTNTGRAVAEATSFSGDDGDPILWRLRGIYSLGAVGGSQRVHRLLLGGYRTAAHQIRVTVRREDMAQVAQKTFDGSTFPTAVAPADFYGAGLGAGFQGQAYELEVHLPAWAGRCSALIVDVELLSGSPTSVILDTIALEVSAAGQVYRPGPQRRF